GGLHRDNHSLGRDDFQQGAGVEALDFEHGLVGLDFKKDVTFGHSLAQLLAPVDDLDRLFRLPQLGHDYGFNHTDVPRKAETRRSKLEIRGEFRTSSFDFRLYH